MTSMTSMSLYYKTYNQVRKIDIYLQKRRASKRTLALVLNVQESTRDETIKLAIS